VLLTSIRPREWLVSAIVTAIGMVLWFFAHLRDRAARSRDRAGAAPGNRP
jgi:hypothetical protein